MSIAVGEVYDVAQPAKLLSQTVFLGTVGGGVWKSENILLANAKLSRSPFWEPLTDQSPLPNYFQGWGEGVNKVGAVAIAAPKIQSGQSFTVVAGTQGGGATSTNNGNPNSWAYFLGGNLAGKRFNDIVADPTNPNRLFAAIAPGGSSYFATPNDLTFGVYRSDDAGATWTRTGMPGAKLLVTDIEVTVEDATNAVTIYAGVIDFSNKANSGVYFSTNNGASWNAMPGLQSPDLWRVSLAASQVPSSAENVYSALYGSVGGTNKLIGVYRSEWTGAWTTNPLAAQPPEDVTGGEDGYLAFGMAPSGRIYFGGWRGTLNANGYSNPPDRQTGILELNSKGTEWSKIDYWPATDPEYAQSIYPHTDLWSWGFDSKGTVYSGNDGGIYRYNPFPFEKPEQYKAGDQPHSVAVADFFGNDGKADLVVANYNDNSLSTFQNNGDGSFANPTKIDLPGKPVFVLAADFNGDGQIDIATAGYVSPGKVTVLLNDNGKFDPSNANKTWSTNYTLDGHPRSLIAEDLNADGKIDLVSINGEGRSFTVLLGQGDGTFLAQASQPVGPTPSGVKSWPGYATAADFDGDNVPDLAVSDYNNGLWFFKGKGDGTFTVSKDVFAAGSGARAIVAGKFDGDQFIDLAAVFENENKLRVIKGNGDGTFAITTTIDVGSNPWDVGAKDLNRDGLADLVVVNHKGSGISVLYGKGNGDFYAPVKYASDSHPTALAIADIDATGSPLDVPDVIVTHKDNQRVSVFINNKAIAGFLNTPDSFGKWENLNTPGLNTLLANSVAAHTTNPNLFVMGTQDNGLGRTTATNATEWTYQTGGDGGLVRFDPRQGSFVAYAMDWGGLMYRNANVLAKNDATGWEVVHPQDQQLTNFPFQAVFDFSAKSPDRVLLGSKTGIFARDFAGANPNWSTIGPLNPAGNPFVNNSAITALSVAPTDENVVYVGYGTGEAFWTDKFGGADGKTWDPIGGVAIWNKRLISDIVIDPTDAKSAFVSLGKIDAGGKGMVYSTTDSGKTWTDINEQLPKTVPVNALLIDVDNGKQVLYAANNMSVYRAMVGKAGKWVWELAGDRGSLPNVEVRDLQLRELTNGQRMLTAATYGRGVWQVGVQRVVLNPGAIGDYVWLDQNSDGLQSAGEIGIGGIGVSLVKHSETGTEVVATTWSFSDGYYEFTNVEEGKYSVVFSKPTGYAFTAQGGVPGEPLDSDPDQVTGETPVFEVAEGQFVNTIDAGFLPGFVGDRAWYDINSNGQQDLNEPGVANVPVNLLDAAGKLLQGTFTNDNGFYQFAGLLPGTYSVEFVPTSGLLFTAPDQGNDDAVDSDADVVNGRTAPFDLAGGQGITTVDAGFVAQYPVSIGDRLWRDLDANGRQDPGEPAIVGVSVNLLNAAGVQLLTTSSSINGSYGFSGLYPGTYSVEFVAPIGFHITAQDQGSNDFLDSDADPLTGRTPNFTLGPGESISTVDVGFVSDNGDAFIVVSGIVFNDLDADGLYDPEVDEVLPGVDVFAHRTSKLQGSTVSDDNGAYWFVVEPGSLQIRFDKSGLAGDWEFSPKDQGTDDNVDSDVDATGRSDWLNLTASSPDIDNLFAGLYESFGGQGMMMMGMGSDGGFGPMAPFPSGLELNSQMQNGTPMLTGTAPIGQQLSIRLGSITSAAGVQTPGSNGSSSQLSTVPQSDAVRITISDVNGDGIGDLIVHRKTGKRTITGIFDGLTLEMLDESNPFGDGFLRGVFAG